MTNLQKQKITLTGVLFFLYCLLIVWVVVFKTSFSLRDIESLIRERSLNLIPFYYDNEISIRFHVWEIQMNLLLFVPFGLYLKMLDAANRRAILYGLSLSLALELCQLIFGLGACDITDLITNTLGTAAGVYLYVLLHKIFKNRTKLNKVLSVLALTATILLGLLFLLLYLANR